MDGEVQEELLVQQVAKRPILVPEFTEDGECRIDAYWDKSNLDSDVVALAHGRPIFDPNLDDTLSDSNADVEEQMECQVLASETCSSPFDAEVEEEPLTQVRIDRTAPIVESHQRLECLDELLEKNRNGPKTAAVDDFDVSEPAIELETNQVAFAAPPGFCDSAEPVLSRVDRQPNNNVEFPNSSIQFTPNKIESEAVPQDDEPMIELVQASSVHSAPGRPVGDVNATPSEVVDYVSQVVDRAVSVAMNFDKGESEGGFVEEEPLIAVTKVRPAESTPAGFFRNNNDPSDVEEPLLVSTKIDRVMPRSLVRTSSEEEENVSSPAIHDPHIVPRAEDNQPHVVEEVMVEVKLPSKKLDDKVIDDKLRALDVEEEVIQCVTEKKAEAAPKIVVTEDLIVSQPQKNSVPPTSADSTVGKLKQKDAVPEPAPLQTKPPSAKPKSKGFFSFFKRTPKTKKREMTQSEHREKSNSLPKSMTPADMERERSSTLHKSDDGKKSGFFTFGSRGRRVSDKNTLASPEAKPVGGSLNALSDKKTDSGKLTPTSKTNIRVFQIMAETGKEPEAGHEEAITADNVRLTASQPPTNNELGRDQVAAPSSVVVTPDTTKQPSVRNSAPKDSIPGAGDVAKNTVRTQGPGAGQPAVTSKYLIVVAIDFGWLFFHMIEK